MHLNNYFSIKGSSEPILQIGKKAYDLLDVQEDLTPTFIIIKVNLFQLWLSNPKKAISVLDLILPKIKLYFKGKKVIIRSSASKENFELRGYYESSGGNISLGDIKSEVLKLWDQNQPMLESDSELNFGLIIQEYIAPILIGHLSNERRLSKVSNRWYYEILNDKNEIKGNKYFIVNENKNGRINPICRTKRILINVLQEIASLKYPSRAHYEWVWDGNRIWIVQRDFESKIQNRDFPGMAWDKKGKITSSVSKSLHVLKTISESKKDWKKVECVKVFKQVGLPTGEIYIIEGNKILTGIVNDTNINQLDEDLEWLLSSPIVVRTDIANDDKHTYLLPRTETLFKKNDVKQFLKKNIVKLKKQGIELDKMCFLLHRFIISKSCALAYSKLDIPRTRIDSTWGIVDGLYYHPHDSFEYNSSNQKKKKRIRCKTEYLDIDGTGNWVSKRCNEDLDWKNSLTLGEIKKISSYNEKLTTFLKKPVIVMYFVGVFKNTGYPQILPWYYTVEEIPESSEKFSELVFSEKKIVISNPEEFNSIKDNYSINKEINKITLQLKLLPSLLRDRDFLEEIGDFSFQNHIPVELEGSILSHPYYILKKKGAIVKAKNPFSPEYPKQEFYKLVRDNIPVMIKSKGESVKAIRITPAQTLELIKQKLIEEAFECFWESKPDNIIEELADVYELLRGASNIFGIDIKEIKKIADKKKEKRGGFDESVFLLETKEESLIQVKKMKKSNGISFDLEDATNNNKESIIPIHKKSIYSKERHTLSIPYVPTLINLKSNKREEYVSIDSKTKYLISFDKKHINVQILNKGDKKDDTEYKIEFDENNDIVPKQEDDER